MYIHLLYDPTSKSPKNRISSRPGRGALTKKSKSKSQKKDSQLVLRLDKAERDEFVELCKELDTTAAREIRHFMRDFVKAHKED